MVEKVDVVEVVVVVEVPIHSIHTFSKIIDFLRAVMCNNDIIYKLLVFSRDEATL